MNILQLVSRSPGARKRAGRLAVAASAAIVPLAACGGSEGSGSLASGGGAASGAGGNGGPHAGGAGGSDAAARAGGTAAASGGGAPASGGGGSGGTGSSQQGGGGNIGAGMGGSTPTGGGAGASGAADGAVIGECAKSPIAPSQLVFLGDSYLTWPTSTILQHIEQHLQMEGSSAYSATPRRYDASGANMMQIVDQYTTAHSQDPNIDTIIMDGGGNDVLINDRSCLTQAPPANQGCTNTVNNTVMLAGQALLRMQMDGVKHVIFFFYPHVQTVGLSGPAANDTLDYAYPIARGMCESVPICVFVDTRPPWDGHVNDYIDPLFGLNVHPNEQGSRAIVDGAIWPAIVSACVLQ
jgi:hypothetical protein